MMEKHLKMMDDQAVLRQMSREYSNPDVKFLIKWLILEIEKEIEENTG